MDYVVDTYFDWICMYLDIISWQVLQIEQYYLISDFI